MHLDLWPAPMRAGLCGGSRLPTRGGVASTPEFGGRPEAKAEAPAILPDEATRPGAKAAGGLVQTSGNVEGHQGAIGDSAPRTISS